MPSYIRSATNTQTVSCACLQYEIYRYFACIYLHMHKPSVVLGAAADVELPLLIPRSDTCFRYRRAGDVPCSEALAEDPGSYLDSSFEAFGRALNMRILKPCATT